MEMSSIYTDFWLICILLRLYHWTWAWNNGKFYFQLRKLHNKVFPLGKVWFCWSVAALVLRSVHGNWNCRWQSENFQMGGFVHPIFLIYPHISPLIVSTFFILETWLRHCQLWTYFPNFSNLVLCMTTLLSYFVFKQIACSDLQSF